MTLDSDDPWWTQQRKELLRWFEDRAPSFVDGYKGAVQLLYSGDGRGSM